MEAERKIDLQNERIGIIRDYLQEKKTVSITELSAMLGVSVVTIRKDLAIMEKEGLLTRTRGGAVLPKKRNGNSLNVQLPSSLEQIAGLAKEHVKPGDFIFLGSGKTCLALAEKIKNIEGISVITNNVTAVSILKPSVGNIILLGGELVQTPDGLITTIDSNVGSSLGSVYVNKAFSSGVGIDSDIGLTVNTMGSTYINRYIPKLCGEWYVMMDAKKFGTKAFYQAASIDQISYLITDVTDENMLAKYRAKNVNVLHP